MNKTSNKNLHSASKAKKDEFYTQLVDIKKFINKGESELLLIVFFILIQQY